MKWLKRTIAKWAKEGNDYDYSRGEKGVSLISRDAEPVPEEDPILTFRIYNANNGKILEFRHYDRKNDRSNNSTYIIEKDRDIGEYVSKCLSLEMLK
jgi:hypothetical protein